MRKSWFEKLDYQILHLLYYRKQRVIIYKGIKDSSTKDNSKPYTEAVNWVNCLIETETSHIALLKLNKNKT
jgi:hypothetical protein